MKNEITIYELLGLIKDNKAPKKIKFGGLIFTYVAKHHNYKDSESFELFGYHILDITNYLYKIVEILPEEKEWENIEEIKHEHIYGLNKKEEKIDDRILKQEETINQLIKNQKYLKEKLEDK